MKKAKSLPKKFERSNKGFPFLYNEKYITNGHFLIPRILVKDDFKYCPPIDGAKRDDIWRVRPQLDKARFIYKKTNRLFDYGDYYVREFTCEDHLSHEYKKAYFNEDYVIFFEIEEINGFSPLDPFILPEKDITLMPCRSPNTISVKP